MRAANLFAITTSVSLTELSKLKRTIQPKALPTFETVQTHQPWTLQPWVPFTDHQKWRHWSHSGMTKLFKLLNQLCEGSKQAKGEYSVFDMMWCCLAQQLYQALTIKHIVEPIQPPSIPTFNDLTTPAHNAAIQVTWQKNKELWDQKIDPLNDSLQTPT